MVDELSARNEVNATAVTAVVQAGVINEIVLSKQDRDTTPVPRQLPGSVPDFVGRVDEIAILDSLLVSASRGAVCCLEGTAGVGKTTLAVWWAHRVQQRFPDGTLFVNLRGCDREQPLRPCSVLTSFLQALGLAEPRIPVGLDAQISMYRSLLNGRRVLVVLDNAGSAEQVRPLLPGSAGCIALVTSRMTLTGLAVVNGAWPLPLDLFSTLEAEALVRGVVRDGRAEREFEAITHLVELCGRLPLALRIAATRVAARARSSIAELVAEIDRGRDRLSGLSDIEDDRSTVRTVFDWSYNRLPAGSASLFRRLGLHPNPEFSRHAAVAFGGIEPTAIRHYLDELIGANLIESMEHHRYRVHDLLHVYAALRAEVDEPLNRRIAVLRRGLTWYARSALAADQLVFPVHPHLAVSIDDLAVELPFAERATAWAWLNTEHHTLLVAAKQAAAHDMNDIAMALVGSMRFLVFRSRALWPMLLEAESLGLRVACACGDADAEMVFLRRRADIYQMLGNWKESDTDLREIASRAVARDNQLLLGEALCGLGRNCKLQRRLDDAWNYYKQALPLVSGSVYVEAVVEANLSQISAGLGRHVEALHHARRELELRGGQDDPVGEGYALHDMAVAHQGLGNDQDAIRIGRRAIAVYRAAVATERYLAEALRTMAVSYGRQGMDAAASRCLSEAAVILTDLGDPEPGVVRSRTQFDVTAPPDYRQDNVGVTT